MAAPRGPTRAPTWRIGDTCIIHMYLNIWFIVLIRPSDYRNRIIPLISSRIINPSVFFNLLRVGLSSTRNSKSQDTWRRERRRIEGSADHRTLIRCTRGPLDLIKSTWLSSSVISVVI